MNADFCLISIIFAVFFFLKCFLPSLVICSNLNFVQRETCTPRQGSSYGFSKTMNTKSLLRVFLQANKLEDNNSADFEMLWFGNVAFSFIVANGSFD